MEQTIEQLQAENAELRKQAGEMRADCERAWAARDVAYEAAKKLREALESLVSESEGVYGLHLNGDPAPWGELLAGGRFEEWLGVFAEELPEFGDPATLAARDARVRKPLEEQIARLEEVCDSIIEAGELADYMGEDPQSATICIREYLHAFHRVMGHLQECDPHGLVSTLDAREQRIRRDAKREVLEEIDRRFVEGPTLHAWLREQLAALDAPPAAKEAADGNG